MIKLTFIGDIMCKSQLIEVYKENNTYDFSEIFEKMKEYFKESNYVFGNLETPITFSNDKLTNEDFCFASPYEFAKSVYDSGIKIVSTANNHCLDRGIEGIKETIKCLDTIGFKHTGIFKSKTHDNLILKCDDIKFGILSYTYGTNAFSNKNYLKPNEKYMVNLFQNQELSNPIDRYCYYHKNIFSLIYNKFMKKIFGYRCNCPVYERKEMDFFCKRNIIKNIKKLKKEKVDCIIMLMHSGGQYNSEPNQNTKKLSEFLIKSGVNIIVGNHEHVVHGGMFEKVKENKLITYSLGNFDGIAGVYAKPYDKMSEYSIALNIYCEKDFELFKIKKITFSVLKTIPTSKGGITTIPVYDLIKNEKNEKEKKKLINDMKLISYKFSEKKYDKVYKEFLII